MVGDQLERQMCRRQGHPQPAAAVILAQQHHRRAVRAGELREKLCLADERLSGSHDRFLVHGGRYQGVQFLAQTAHRSFP